MGCISVGLAPLEILDLVFDHLSAFVRSGTQDKVTEVISDMMRWAYFGFELLIIQRTVKEGIVTYDI